MRRHIKLYVAAIAGLVVGCNQPAVTLKAPAFQSSENTIRDWNDVAHQIATDMASLGLLPTNTQFGPPVGPPPKPVFLRVQAPDSAFVRQVADELQRDVLRSGGAVARSPAGATVVNLDVNFVRWGPRDKPPGPIGTLAAVVAIPGIVIGASEPMSVWTGADAAAFTAVGLGVLLDTAVALTPTMNAEAVWEATIVADDQVIMRLQDQVYIRTPDIPLYAKATSLSPITSWQDHAPLRSRVIRFDP
ncbi:MAG TPA: hypothetical protein VGI78_08305 [Acetobacteraceae bacterium]